jgi:hypothetical protein
MTEPELRNPKMSNIIHYKYLLFEIFRRRQVGGWAGQQWEIYHFRRSCLSITTPSPGTFANNCGYDGDYELSGYPTVRQVQLERLNPWAACPQNASACVQRSCCATPISNILSSVRDRDQRAM